MSVKIAAENWSSPWILERVAEKPWAVVVAEYNEDLHKTGVEELERRCEVGQRGSSSLVTDLMGDPLCRIRHFPTHVMMVAEFGEEREIVGVVRGCIKTVTKGNTGHVKLAYLLGLRVSPTHRRLGTGTKLVEHLEEWCKQKGAEYAYMATDCANEASINLFTKKCGYVKFRALAMLVQPVHAHYKPINSSTVIDRLPPLLAELIYRKHFDRSEFFPNDIRAILSNKLNLGTFIAYPRNQISDWDPKAGFLPQSFAILSVWNTKEVFKLQMKGLSRFKHACCVGTRLLDSWMPWLRVPSIPDVFSQFGVYFLYGLHMEGIEGWSLMRSLCAFVHNMARDDGGCGGVVAEVGQSDQVRDAVPHWKKFSMNEDLWCIKNLGVEDDNLSEGFPATVSDHWISTKPSTPVIFVDPRDF